MKDVREIYPGLGEEPFYGPGNYVPLLESLGNILLQVDDVDYQGDSRVLFFDRGRYGVLLFGWGSCSGCDCLQGASTYAELDALQSDLKARIKWGTREEILILLKSKDWETEATYRTEETKEFVDKALAILTEGTI